MRDHIFTYKLPTRTTLKCVSIEYFMYLQSILLIKEFLLWQVLQLMLAGFNFNTNCVAESNINAHKTHRYGASTARWALRVNGVLGGTGIVCETTATIPHVLSGSFRGFYRLSTHVRHDEAFILRSRDCFKFYLFILNKFYFIRVSRPKLTKTAYAFCRTGISICQFMLFDT